MGTVSIIHENMQLLYICLPYVTDPLKNSVIVYQKSVILYLVLDLRHGKHSLFSFVDNLLTNIIIFLLLVCFCQIARYRSFPHVSEHAVEGGHCLETSL